MDANGNYLTALPILPYLLIVSYKQYNLLLYQILHLSYICEQNISSHYNNNNQAFYSQASWGRLEMKPQEQKRQTIVKKGGKQRVIKTKLKQEKIQ
jgi:hypothetical protein